MEKLSLADKNFCTSNVAELRGKTKDIAIKGKCAFLEEGGCRLPINLRVTDCITFPVYPKLKENQGNLTIDNFVLHKECPFSEEISNDKNLLRAINDYWIDLMNKVDKQDVIDWIGDDEEWIKWYKNTISISSEEVRMKMIDNFRDFSELESKQYSNYLQDLFALEPNKPFLQRTNNTLSEDEIEEIKRLGSKHEFSSEDGEITCYIYDDKIYVTDMRIKYENNYYKQKY